MKKFYTSRFDRIFKSIFFKEKDHELLEELIMEITEIVINIEKIVNCELPISDIKEKEKRVDGIIDSANERIHIEVNTNVENYYRMRNYLYFAAVMIEDIKRGKRYDPNKKYIHISLDFSSENSLENITTYKNYDLVNKVSTINNVILYYVNITKIKEICKDNIALQKRYSLLYALDLDKEKLIEYAERTDNTMVKKYKNEIMKLNDDAMIIKSLTHEEDQEMLVNAIKDDYMNRGVKKGRELGIVEGRKLGVEDGISQNKLETAKKLLEMLMPIKDIIKVTNLPEQRVIEIKNRMNFE